MIKLLVVIFVVILVIGNMAFAGPSTLSDMKGSSCIIPTLDVYVSNSILDSIYISFGDHNMLVDFGTASKSIKVIEMLKELGVTNIDYLLNTHPHGDHIGGLKKVIEYLDGCDEFITGFSEDGKGNGLVRQREAVKILNDNGIPIHRVFDGDKLEFGDIMVQVIQKPEATTLNGRSLVLWIKYKQRSLLLSGDIDGLTQYDLTKVYCIKADILKYPHHGIGYMRSDFLMRVNPKFVFFTSNLIATKKAQAQLKKYGIPYVFSSQGIVHLSTNGYVWRWNWFE